jgi:hypothetical protein
MLQFVITARLEFQRSPSLRGSPAVVSAMQGFYGSMVEDAIARGDSGRHRSGGSGEHAAGDVSGNGLLRRIHCRFKQLMPVVAKQLHQLMTHGVLDLPKASAPPTITPPVPVAVPVDDFVDTWPGLTG